MFDLKKRKGKRPSKNTMTTGAPNGERGGGRRRAFTATALVTEKPQEHLLRFGLQSRIAAPNPFFSSDTLCRCGKWRHPLCRGQLAAPHPSWFSRSTRRAYPGFVVRESFSLSLCLCVCLCVSASYEVASGVTPKQHKEKKKKKRRGTEETQERETKSQKGRGRGGRGEQRPSIPSSFPVSTNHHTDNERGRECVSLAAHSSWVCVCVCLLFLFFCHRKARSEWE